MVVSQWARDKANEGEGLHLVVSDLELARSSG